jgi:hypothetical protein
MDNAHCHTVKTEKLPTSWNKKIILFWLTSKEIPMGNEQLLKVEMLILVSKYSSIHDKNVVEEMAKVQNKTVLHLVAVFFV